MTTQDLLQKAYDERDEAFKRMLTRSVSLTNREIPQHIVALAEADMKELNAMNKYLADNPALRTLLDLVLAEVANNGAH